MSNEHQRSERAPVDMSPAAVDRRLDLVAEPYDLGQYLSGARQTQEVPELEAARAEAKIAPRYRDANAD